MVEGTDAAWRWWWWCGGTAHLRRLKCAAGSVNTHIAPGQPLVMCSACLLPPSSPFPSLSGPPSCHPSLPLYLRPSLPPFSHPSSPPLSPFLPPSPPLSFPLPPSIPPSRPLLCPRFVPKSESICSQLSPAGRMCCLSVCTSTSSAVCLSVCHCVEFF